MGIAPELLEILACPVCKVGVELTPDEKWLKCPQCRRKYPIEEDIPVMLVNRAVLDEDETSASAPASEPTSGAEHES